MAFWCCDSSVSADVAVLSDFNADSEYASGKSAVLEQLAPAAAAAELITLEISDEQSMGKLAIETADMDHGPLISKVSSEATFDPMPKPFDRIVMVNGVKGRTVTLLEMMQTTQKSDTLRLTLQRPKERQIVLQKPGALGVTLNYKKSSMGIAIKDLHDEGLVTLWNAANPDLAVACGDRIVAVNKVTEPVSQDLFEELKSADRLEITVNHY
eukprot:TRINITY_DN95397_c0_g1_i1.p1 TRINITY_DN95397_c0_g1~~TRINITY_DN95397_c0_g1_i1.p1  ORF type:complete len:212 (-),score=43.81 TRINITY_DN95397_c0_g1_i1:152-787(-)